MSDYSEQVKAQALAALLAGQAPVEVARLYNIPVGTLRSWKSRQLNSDGVAIVATESRERIGTMLIEYIEVTLSTLIVQQRVFANAEWLLKQSAAEAATLHGLSVDKTIRLLEGLAESESAAPALDAD